MFGVGLIIAAAAIAAGPRNLANDLRAIKRAHHAYDNLPAQAKTLAPNVISSRRVATAVDKKKRKYYVYVAQMKDKTACIVLIQGKSATSDCLPVTLLFEPGRRETTSTANGLIGVVSNVVRDRASTTSVARICPGSARAMTRAAVLIASPSTA